MIRYSFFYIWLCYLSVLTNAIRASTDMDSGNNITKFESIKPEFNITTINGVHHEYFDRVTCEHNPDICEKPVCKLRFKTRLTKSLTIGCSGLKKPAETFLAKATLYYRFTSGFKKFLLDREEDVCKYLKGERSQLVLNLLFPNLKYALEMNAVCPMTEKIMINDLILGIYLFNNQFLPAGDYFIMADVHTKEYLIMSAKIYFNVPDGKSITNYAMG